MDAHAGLLNLGEAGAAERARVGGKAGVLGELAAAGLPVPPGFVVTAADLDADGWEVALAEAAGELGGSRFAVRSSGAAEDLPDASYAGLYETYLNVPLEELPQAVRRCFAAAGAERVRAYQRAARRQSRRDGGLGAGDGRPGLGRGGVHCPSGDRRPRSDGGHRRRRAG